MTTMVCPFACPFSTDSAPDLRQHARQTHGRPVPNDLAWWPEFSSVEFVRLTFWRTMRIEGWAIAMEAVA